jgi:NAD(P)-dependent dehydrogenase (short-subunit alcohol dehydrogenase family)
VLSGRRIVVTGASSGIGKGLALAFANAGARVWAVARTEDDLPGSPSIKQVVADLTSGSGRRAVATAVEHAVDGLDVVVHAAGALGAPSTDLVEYPERDWRAVLEINLTAVQLLHQTLAPLLDAGDSPAVIALSSTVGRQGRAGWGAYAVSKYGLEGWIAVLTAEWEGGRVYSVNPGGTRTPMRAAAMPDEDPNSIPTPDDISPIFLRLAHPACSDASGTLFNARDWIGTDPWEGISGS